MRILYLGNVQGFNNIDKYYLIPQKLINGFTRLGNTVYTFNDRDFARSSNIFNSQKLGKMAMNTKVVDLCKEYQPHLIVLGHCKNVSNETLRQVKKVCSGVRIIYRNVDPLTQCNNANDIQQRCGIVDAIFITTAGKRLKQFHNPQTPIYFFPNPVDIAVENIKAFANPSANIDLLFMASALRHTNDHRAILASYLESNQGKLNFLIGGAGLNEHKVYGAAYIELLNRSKMGLSISKESNHYLYASDRMSQYMGCGLLTFIPKGSNFEEILGENTFITYTENEELLDKIRFYADNEQERITIASAGWERIHQAFNVDDVCQYMIDRAFDQPLTHHYEWPITAY